MERLSRPAAAHLSGQAATRRRQFKPNPRWRESESRKNRVDERAHFKRFKRSHKEFMALAQPIERTNFTRSNGNGAGKGMQGIVHLPESLPSKQHWREVFRNLWYRFEREWEPVVVNKQIDSVTMPKWVAIAILGAMLAFMAQSYWRSSDQRDMIIELKTEVRMSRESEAEKSRQLKEQADLNQVRIEAVTGELKTIKGMLSMQQMATLENTKRGNN